MNRNVDKKEKNKKYGSEKKGGDGGSSKKKEEGGTKKKSKKSKEESGGRVIRLLGNRSVHHVAIDDFVKVSEMIKKQQNAGTLMTSVDLHRFSDQSILAFVNYVQKREINSALTYYATTELITLAKTFQMTELKGLLEDNIIEASKNSEGDLLQALLICDVTHVNPETERALQLAAIESIDKIVTLPDFHKMPFHQLYQILSSCEINATHEMFIADVVLLWLGGQSHVNSYAPAMLGCIRTKFLSPVDKTLIIERANILNMPDKMVRLARNMLECGNSQRICMDPTHLKKNFPRCGQAANLSNFGTHSSLPLSRPNFTIKVKASKEQQKKKGRPNFDPATAPKVIDLIQQEPTSKSTKETKTKKVVQNPITPTTPTKKKKQVSTKSKCACIQYIKNRMQKKNPRGAHMLDRKNMVKVKPPGSVSKSTKSTNAKSSSMKSSTSKMEKKIEGRRNDKKERVRSAMDVTRKNSDRSINSSAKVSTSNKSDKTASASKTK